MSGMQAVYVLLLTLAPSGMAVAFYRGRRAEREDLTRTFADEVEMNLRVRNHG